MKKIIVTGGHLSPAISVIERLPSSTEVLFIGRKYVFEGDKSPSLEYQKIKSMDIKFLNLISGRLQRTFTKYTLFSLLKLPVGLIQSIFYLSKYKPDVLLSFGGYISVPVGFSAFMLGIPLVIHEQTRKAGLANKLLIPFAKKICISWPESAAFFPQNKTVLTGIPLRKSFFHTPDIKNKNNLLKIYITGGSAGAHALNKLVEGCLKELLQSYHVIHQTGAAVEFKDYENLSALRKSLPEPLRSRYTLLKFVDPDQVADIMTSAGLVVSRSGMNTVAELLFLNKPCVLVPLPHGQNNEQLENAVFLQKIGLGEIIKQETATSEMLYSQINKIIAKLGSRKYLKAKEYINHDAAKEIVEIVTKISQ